MENLGLFLIVFAAFFFGVAAGGYLRDLVWCNKANGSSGMLCGKKFYRVTHDNSLDL